VPHGTGAKLTKFLEALTPFERHYLLNEMSTEEGRAWAALSKRKQTALDVLFHRYLLLVLADKKARARYRRRSGAIGTDFIEKYVLGTAKSRGSPRKPVAQRQDVRVASEVKRQAARLAQGFKLKTRLDLCTSQRTIASLSVDLRDLFSREGYTASETDVIVTSHTPESAATRVMAEGDEPKLLTIRAAASRGKKLLRMVGSVKARRRRSL
jgi:hypothetical protein